MAPSTVSQTDSMVQGDEKNQSITIFRGVVRHPRVIQVPQPVVSVKFLALLHHCAVRREDPFALRKHACAIFNARKNDNFHLKMFDYFLIFAQNIDCGYTFEPPQ